MNLALDMNKTIAELEEGLNLNDSTYFSDMEVTYQPLGMYLKDTRYAMIFFRALVNACEKKKINLNQYINLKKQLISSTQNYINYSLNMKPTKAILFNEKKTSRTDEEIVLGLLRHKFNKMIETIYELPFIDKLSIDENIQIMNSRTY